MDDSDWKTLRKDGGEKSGTYKSRENYLRRYANRLGLSLLKSRAKLWSINNQQGYMIVDANSLAIVHGEKYGLDLEDVERFLTQYEAELRKKR